MPFKVRCTCIGTVGDEEHFACHFNYKIGEEFTYDGERFEGRVCQGLFRTVIPLIHITMFSGNRHHERILFRYSGPNARDESRKEYDGVGFRPLTEPPEDVDEKYFTYYNGKRPKRPQALVSRGGYGAPCHDCRTSVFFVCEPVDLASGGDSLPYYRREMSILDKVKEEPGLTAQEIWDRFTEWEREEIYPPLTVINTQLMLEELEEVDYVELKDGKAYPLERAFTGQVKK